MARCPAHDDRSPSLSIKELPDGRVLVHCHAGCGALDVIAAVGLEWDALFPPTDRNYPAERRQRAESIDELVIAIARSDMAKGIRLSATDMERYQLALLRVNKVEVAA